MGDTLFNLFSSHPELAIAISLAASILVAILGLVPSVFITAANILFFGFWNGTLLSLAGEIVGAALAFLLYRKGFQKKTARGLEKYPKVQQIILAEGKAAAWLIFSLRLIPFVPSGLITFAGAIGKVSFLTFVMASSLGKIPALLMEAWSVYQVTKFGWEGKAILLVVGIGMVYWVIKKVLKKRSVNGSSQPGS